MPKTKKSKSTQVELKPISTQVELKVGSKSSEKKIGQNQRMKFTVDGREYQKWTCWKTEWIGNVKTATQKPEGAQGIMLKTLTPETIPVLSYTHKMGRLYSHVTFDSLNTLLKTNKGIYEIQIPDRKRKVLFDLDKTTLSDEEIKEKLLPFFPNANFQISGREEGKLRWVHVVLSNYYAENLDAMFPVRIIAKRLEQDGFDVKIYTKNRYMKCTNQAKPNNKPIQKIISGSVEQSKHLTLADFDEGSIDISTIDFNLHEVEEMKKLPLMSQKHKLDILAIPQFDFSVPHYFDLHNAYPIDKLGMLPCAVRGTKGSFPSEICFKVMIWCRDMKLSFETFWNWCKGKDDSLSRYQKYDKLWNSKKEIHTSTKVMDVLLERFYPKINIPQATNIFKSQFDLGSEIIFTAGEYLTGSDIPKNVKYVSLVSPMGKNKTGGAGDHLKDVLQSHLGGNGHLLWISPRITLSQNTKARLSNMGIEVDCYKDFEVDDKLNGKMESGGKLINSIQSMHYLKRDYDYIVIDEIETVLNTFSGDCSTHNGNVKRNWGMFLSLMKKAKQVIFMDAFYSKLTLNIVNGMLEEENQTPQLVNKSNTGMIKKSSRGERVKHVIINTKGRPTQRFFKEYYQLEGMITHAAEAIKNGEKVYFFAPCKTGKYGVEDISKTISNLTGLINGIGVRSYFSEKEEEKRALIDVEKIWSHESVRIIVTNSCISVGVNFDLKDIFDRVYCIYSPQISVRDFFQAINRVRHPKENIFHLFRTSQSNADSSQGRLAVPENKLFLQMRQDLQIEVNANKNVKKGEYPTFDFFCEMTNMSIIPEAGDMVTKENAKYISKMLKDTDSVFDWDKILDMATNPSTVKEIESMIFSSKSTLEMRLQYMKFCFRKVFRVDADEEVLKLLWKKSPELPLKIKDYMFMGEEEYNENFTNLYSMCHIVRALFKENNATLGETLPPQMSTKIPLKKIRQSFDFHNAPTSHGSNMCSRMINAFFGFPLYQYSKRKQNDGKRVYEYETNEKNLDMIVKCQSQMKIIIGRKQNLDFKIELDEDM